MNLGAGLDHLLYERDHTGGGVIGDAAQTDSPEPFGLRRLHCYDYLSLRCLALAPHRRDGILAVGDGQIGFINFDLAFEALTVW